MDFHTGGEQKNDIEAGNSYFIDFVFNKLYMHSHNEENRTG